MRHIEQLFSEMSSILEFYSVLNGEYKNMESIDVNNLANYTDIIAKVESDSYVFIDMINAFDSIVDSLDIDDMGAHEFSYRYTNFFTSEAINIEPFAQMIEDMLSYTQDESNDNSTGEF